MQEKKPFEITEKYINDQAEKAKKELYSRVRKDCRSARDTNSKVSYKLGTMIEAKVPIETIYKVYRQGVDD